MAIKEFKTKIRFDFGRKRGHIEINNRGIVKLSCPKALYTDAKYNAGNYIKTLEWINKGPSKRKVT
jgi:hypothetical protein